MSNMQIKIVAVELNTAKTKTGKDYQVVEVTYKNLSFDSKVESKKHNQYGDKTVFNALKDANPGDVFTIERKKDDAGYWQWVGIGTGDSAPSAPAGGFITGAGGGACIPPLCALICTISKSSRSSPSGSSP